MLRISKTTNTSNKTITADKLLETTTNSTKNKYIGCCISENDP